MSEDVLMALLERGTAYLRKAGVDSPRLEARLLLAHALGVSQEQLVAGLASVHPQTMRRFEVLVRRRQAREPLAYILGYREFWSLPFAVGPGVLIPRPETETLIEEALREFPAHDSELAVLDLGTGSGCLLLSFLFERPCAVGLGIDSSLDALQWAVGNAPALDLAGRVEWHHGNWTDGISDTFDVIFANPPYIDADELKRLAPDVAQYEPCAALSGGDDGLAAYREIVPHIAQNLAGGGRAFIEIGAGQAEAVGAILADASLTLLRTVPDLSGIARCLVVGHR